MARREALRELQARLAERLQAARAEARPLSWLAVECAGVGLLVPLAQAGEIFPWAVVQAVPQTQSWFLGVANLRGGLHGVVDLAAFLGLRPPLAADDVARDQVRLLAFNPAIGAHCAVLVDRLAGLRSVEQLQPEVQQAESAGASSVPDDTGPAFAGPVYRDAAGRPWQVLELAALARDEQFLAIAA